jgi:hypothetical protein
VSALTALGKRYVAVAQKVFPRAMVDPHVVRYHLLVIELASARQNTGKANVYDVVTKRTE